MDLTSLFIIYGIGSILSAVLYLLDFHCLEYKKVQDFTVENLFCLLLVTFLSYIGFLSLLTCILIEFSDKPIIKNKHYKNNGK